MQEVNFLQNIHNSTKRNYLKRMTAEKPECMRIAKQWDYDYWDGERKYGFGGYYYDGRWRTVAEEMTRYYGLKKNTEILDIGCGKGHLLLEFKNISMDVIGGDISGYATNFTKDEIKNYLLQLQNGCQILPWVNEQFDFTYSINVFHNLGYNDLKSAIKEMVRVTKPDGHSYICVESYRNEEELQNLQCWALTCASFYKPDDWKEILTDNGYTGDVEFIYFE